MTGIIIELSKYFMILCIAFYTLHGFIVFRQDSPEEQRGYFIMQNIFMIMIHMAGFLVLFLESRDFKLVLFYVLQEVVILAAIILLRVIYPLSNPLIINNMSLLLSVSFIILARLSMDKCYKQFMIVIAGLILSFIIIFFMKFAKTIFCHFTFIYGVLGIVILSVVLIMGSVTYGSKLSFTIKGITFQPSELVKLLFVFFIAAMYTKSASFKQVIITTVFAAVHIGILALSKDLGSALIFFVVYLVMLYIATNKIFYLLFGIISGAFAGIAGYRLFSHVRTRVIAWKDPFSVIDGQGYQITQSLFAIGTGSWFGMGLGQGSPNKIPVVEADFIFSAIAEEMGCIFAICLILICISNFLMFMNISLRMKDTFYKLVAAGIAVIYGFQMFLTIGGVTKFIPLTGVTLPLVSYGGTSVIVTLTMFSIIQGLYRLRNTEAVVLKDASALKPEASKTQNNKKGIKVPKQPAAAQMQKPQPEIRHNDNADEVSFDKIYNYTRQQLEDDDFEFID